MRPGTLGERRAQRLVGERDAVLDVGREVVGAGRGDDVDLQRHAGAQLDRDPGATGEFTHSSRWIWWPGLRKMPKNGSPRWREMISWSAPPVWPMCSAPYHSATASK